MVVSVAELREFFDGSSSRGNSASLAKIILENLYLKRGERGRSRVVEEPGKKEEKTS